MTLGEALAAGKKELERRQAPSPFLNAEVLLQRLLGVEKIYLVAHAERELTVEEEKKYFAWLERRAAGEPAQYITGHQEFWGLDFLVTPDVLIPRPGTEHLVESVLVLNQKKNPVIVDVGVGSGCIAIALAKEIPHATIYAVDQSKAALQVAARNAERLGVCSQIDFRFGDLLLPFDDEFCGAFDFVVSNPPYVPAADRPSLQVEVRAHEPAVALHSFSDDPILIYRRLIEQSFPRLHRGGFLVMEIGAGQKEKIEKCFDPKDWTGVHFVNDLQSIPRVVAARRV